MRVGRFMREAASWKPILALSCCVRRSSMSDDLDFSSSPAGAQKPAPAAAPPPQQGALYIPAIARSFFESAGKEEAVGPGTVFFAENEKAGFLKRDKMYFLVEGQVVLAVKGRPIGEVKAGQIFGEMA